MEQFTDHELQVIADALRQSQTIASQRTADVFEDFAAFEQHKQAVAVQHVISKISKKLLSKRNIA